jgi:hypothetical protein
MPEIVLDPNSKQPDGFLNYGVRRLSLRVLQRSEAVLLERNVQIGVLRYQPSTACRRSPH